MQKKFTVIPAILPNFFSEIKESLEKIHPVADLVQIDFCDGHFVKSKTWGYNNHDRDIFTKMTNEEFELPYFDKIDFEFDLMIKNPENQIEKFIALGPKNIILHYNSLENPVFFFEQINPIVREHISFGCAFNNDAKIENILEIIPFVDFIQIMGIDNIGRQGEIFNNKTLELIKNIRAIDPEIKISVDGGVNESNLIEIQKAGANSAALGSAIFKNYDPVGAYRNLKSLL